VACHWWIVFLKFPWNLVKMIIHADRDSRPAHHHKKPYKNIFYTKTHNECP